jgi:two-component system, NtrC family, sensor kinase
MASLGGLVAGVAHEVNTPLGIGVTAASFLELQSKKFNALLVDNQLKRSDLDNYVKDVNESALLISANLQRAAELIQSFKRVAVDQNNKSFRPFNLHRHLSQVLLTLQPKIKRSPYTIHLDCPKELEMVGSPGDWSQILTNLVINAIIHGFNDGGQGHMEILVQLRGDQILFRFVDDGLGMEEGVRCNIFEPFFTTRRNQGGAGLGLHIVYNLVTASLGGTIHCESEKGGGTTFIIQVPIQSPSAIKGD